MTMDEHTDENLNGGKYQILVDLYRDIWLRVEKVI